MRAKRVQSAATESGYLMQSKTYRLPVDLIDRIEKARGRERESDFVRRALEDFVTREERRASR